MKKFAHKVMKTADVRVDVKLNKHIWSKGIRNVRPRRDPPASGRRRRIAKLLGFSPRERARADPVAVPSTRQVPRRIRVQISRRRNDDEDAAVRHPPHTSLYGRERETRLRTGLGPAYRLGRAEDK